MQQLRPQVARPWRVRAPAVALAFTLLVLLGGSTWVLRPRHAPSAATAAPAAALDDEAQTGPTPSSATDRNLAFWQGRLRADGRNYIAATLLGATWMQKARETGDVADYTRAETALRAALRVNPGYDRACATLAAILFSEHRFAEALRLAEALAKADPGPTQAYATAADARLELGDVAGAGDAYQALLAAAPSPPVYGRMARLAFLRGDTGGARAFMARAVREAAEQGAAGETLAWYRFQLGELDFTAGRIGDAEAAYGQALHDFPGYYLATSGLAKVAAARGDLDRAAGLYTRAVEVLPRPDLVAALGDVEAARGRSAAARRQYATVEYIGKLAAINRQVYNRQLAVFDADHDLRPAEALRLARAELEVRKDVYGWDAVAWTAYKARDFALADQAARRALALGTRDPRLLYHAGMAALGVGARARARALLAAALATNPAFDLLQAPKAKAALTEAGR